MKDLQKKNTKDLVKDLQALKEKNREISFSAGGAVSKDSFEKRKNRKQIAKILTVLNKK